MSIFSHFPRTHPSILQNGPRSVIVWTTSSQFTMSMCQFRCLSTTGRPWHGPQSQWVLFSLNFSVLDFTGNKLFPVLSRDFLLHFFVVAVVFVFVLFTSTIIFILH